MNLALFDFDGTITTGDTFVPFLRFVLRPSRLVVGGLLTSPVTICYFLGGLPATTARTALARAAFHRQFAHGVQAAGLAYARDILPSCVRPEALERIHWHQHQGDTVVVVSASLDVYLAPWCRDVGVECICSRLEERDGILTGRYRGGDCSGPEKARRVLQRFDLAQYGVVFAYGDTPEDDAMLRLAHRRSYRWKDLADRGSSAGALRRRGRTASG